MNVLKHQTERPQFLWEQSGHLDCQVEAKQVVRVDTHFGVLILLQTPEAHRDGERFYLILECFAGWNLRGQQRIGQ